MLCNIWCCAHETFLELLSTDLSADALEVPIITCKRAGWLGPFSHKLIFLKKKLYNKAIWAAIFTLRSLFVQHSLFVQLDNTIFRLIKIHTCSFFVIVSRLQTKHNVRITPEALQINHLSCVHIAFTMHSLWTLCSLTIHRS